MSSTPSFDAPTLSPVGSTDMFTTYGNCVYQIVLDSDMCTLGNILMFEYKITNADVSTITPTNTVFGYVNLDYATAQNGIQNQWNLTIASENNNYNPSVARQISVRAYTGLTGTSGGNSSPEIGVSPWSNLLDVHNPPEEPTIYKAYYDAPSTNNDDLYIMLNVNNSYNYAEIKFVVAYYYSDVSGNTVWNVTDPLTVSAVTYNNTNYKLLSVPEFGTVSSAEGQRVVYTAVYAVYSYRHLGKDYYSVSHISNTVNAGLVAENSAPIITSIDYAVYGSSYPPQGNQNQDVKFIPPAAIVLPSFRIEYYILEVKKNDGNWLLLSDNIIGSTIPGSTGTTSYVYNPYDQLNARCGDTIHYRMRNKSTTGTLSPWSPTKSINIFVYSTVPRDLVMDYAAYDNSNGDITLRCKFKNPENIGCGLLERAFYVSVLGAGDTGSANQTITYDSSTTTYTVEFNLSQPFSQVGTISCYYRAKDTNSSTLRQSETVSIPYVVSNIALAPLVYSVYTPPYNSQNLSLAWSNPISGLPAGWTVNSYNVYLKTSGTYTSAKTLVHTTTDLNYTHSIGSPYNVCGTKLTFLIEADVSNNGTNSILSSNERSMNYYEYAEAPTSLLVNWSAVVVGATGTNNAIDVSVSFKNPTDNGCGSPAYNGVGSWVVQLCSGNPVSGTVLATQYPDYIGTVNHMYNVYFDNVTYTSVGYVNVYLVTRNSNHIADSTVLPQHGEFINGINATASFVSSALPIIQDLTINELRTSLTFNVYTETILKPFAKLSYFDYDNGQTQRHIPIHVKNQPYIMLSNNVYKYNVTLGPNDIVGFSSVPSYASISVANDVGIEAQSIPEGSD